MVTTDQTQKLHEKDINNYVQTFRRYPIVLEKGRGARVWDIEGREYIDALAGIAVNNVGHCHPRVVKAIQEQAAQLIHISNFYLSLPQAQLSEHLLRLSGMDRVFLTNSGAESVEGALKFARKYAHSKGRGGVVISMQGSFHGRTLATIATGKKRMQLGFDPIPTGFMQVPFNDLDEIHKVTNKNTAAIILEPVQGEGGINVADKAFLRDLRDYCDERDLVLIFDEVQCGVGRTGHWFAKDYFGVEPDIMSLAKGLGGGAPVGAVLCKEKINEAMDFGDHGTTFGGNPLVSAAALATLEVIEEENLLEETRKKGEWMKGKIMALNSPHIHRVKGLGLMLGVEFDFETKSLVKHMLEENVLANATAGNILRLVPPLNISYEELGLVVNAIAKALEKVKQEHA